MSYREKIATQSLHAEVVDEIGHAGHAALDEYREAFESIGVTPPAWSKLNLSQKRAWLLSVLPSPPEKPVSKATMPKDQKWKRQSRREVAARVKDAGYALPLLPAKSSRQMERRYFLRKGAATFRGV